MNKIIKISLLFIFLICVSCHRGADGNNLKNKLLPYNAKNIQKLSRYWTSFTLEGKRFLFFYKYTGLDDENGFAAITQIK